jgi:phosphatidate cytidylyltransferase
MKNFITRLLTGIAYVALICIGILWNAYSFLVLFAAIVAFCLREFYGLMRVHKQIRIHSLFHCSGGILLFVITFLYASGAVGLSAFSAYLVYIVTALIMELYEKQPDPITHIACILLGQLYIALPFSALNLIAFHDIAGASPVYHPVFILSLFLFIWANDTGAYLIGCKFGKHRLFERISPKKSWEGFWGGLGFAVITALIFAYFMPNTAWYHWVGIATVVVAFGTWGDLFESLLKRTLNIKDSGQSLPGHGGLLDRFDSLLLAIYAMLFYTQLFLG